MGIDNKKVVIGAIASTVVIVLASVVAITLQGSNNNNSTSSDVTLPTSENVSRDQLLQDANKGKRLKIMTTFYPLYEFAKAVVGDRADVDLLIPSGLEPHDWEPSARDLERLKDYQILIYNSAIFEPYIDKVKGLGYDLKMVEAASGMVLDQDPHVWLDPILAKEQVRIIRDAIASMDSDEGNSRYYDENARAYTARLDELHVKFEEGLRDCGRREFITLHSAYNYLVSRYGLKQITITGIEPEHDIPAGKIREIVDLAKRHGIDVVYAEEGIDDRLVRALAEEINAKVLTLSPIEVLDEEDLEEGKTYIAKMEENLENLRLGLGCR
ncbi:MULTISPECIES: metal ABC transporter solute-binding protein, Zn/Mn family [Candidatus Nitrosocaldus]|jgi:zinc transport system substrate-binding protein|uniref:Putative High-affinity zinc uptake system binding-protein ZnuA n=1 Tax=Candidatus Nitrosocaldus cavascurensis TaxID=2058097 RepID=A0A2K5AQL5_9ARCH|nr:MULTISPECIES: zinc ABC transporter substrate-binding protein [Candidatus Nitrosocaldus]SPC33904.1 putative High-affinity zinc uptake system binding-protein ZnuA [Candidatus Nitrosocaldus cavascurensis]